MVTPPNPVAVPTISYEHLFCLPSSERLWPPTRWKAQGLLSGSSTLGTVGHQLRSKHMDTIGSV
jgi:hypothetical protein